MKVIPPRYLEVDRSTKELDKAKVPVSKSKKKVTAEEVIELVECMSHSQTPTDV